MNKSDVATQSAADRYADRKPDIVKSFSKDVSEDPALLYARLRKECPMALQHGARDGSTGMESGWLVTRHEDIVAIARDTDNFRQNIRWPAQPRPPLEMDPPDHRVFRALMMPFFTPAALVEFEPLSRRLATELLEPLLSAGGGDFATGLARPLPAQVLLARINQPLQDWEVIKQASEAVYLQGSPNPEDQHRFRTSNEFLWDYSQKVVEDRKAHPLDNDIVSSMLAAQMNDAPVSEHLIVGMLRLLVAAGHDSTTSALGICLRYLAEHADAQARLRAEPKLISGAIEEILRIQPPVLQMPRIAVRDVEMHGRQIRAGDKMHLVFASGNQDEEAFDQPDVADIERRANRHLSFGTGVHTCIGNGLARQEIKVALEVLLARSKSFRLAGEPAREFWHPYGAVKLPLAVTC